MPLDDGYLAYPLRRRGYDHDRFDYSPLPERPQITWPDSAQIALFVTVNFEYYPLEQANRPVLASSAVPAGLNYIQYTTVDYGNRIGAYRLFRVLDEYGIKATALMNSEVARRYPRLVEEILSRGWEIAASGTDMNHLIAGGMPIDEERALISQSLSTLRSMTGRSVTGWHSPARSESMNTLDLLVEHGIEYVMDWVNDDLPYAVRTASGSIHSLPVSEEWADANIVGAQRQPTEEICRQGMAAYRALKSEAESGGGRIMSLPLHPAVSGQPFRIWAAQKLLAGIRTEGGFWDATGSQIIAAFKAGPQDHDGRGRARPAEG